MYKSLIYKEWLKIRWIVIGLTVINCLVVLNMYFDLLNAFKSQPANSIVGGFQFYEIAFYSDIKLIVLATGLLIGVYQFFPEINQSRLKLTFHLPVKENKLMLQMASVGVVIILAISLLDTLLISLISIKFLPIEFFESMITTTFPWYLGSIVCYLWITEIFVEPNWTKRVVSLFIAIGMVSLFYEGEGFSKYNYSILYFALLTILNSTIIFLSAYNFKRGIV